MMAIYKMPSMNQKIIIGMLIIISIISFKTLLANEPRYTIHVEVHNLRNSNGTVLISLYSREDAFPDENYKKYLKQIVGKIIDGTSSMSFENVPPGKYAVTILHDEDNNGKIKKGRLLPLEGIGFSKYQSIGILNRPTFSKASFYLQSDTTIAIKILYF